MNSSIYSIISVIVISLVSLLGVLTLTINRKILKKIILYLVSFAIGGLLGDAFIHLIPESLEKINIDTVSILLLAGIVLFFILEKIIRWRHCHNTNCEEENHTHSVASINLISDSFHNFIDGVLIAASFLVDIRLGLTTSLAIFFHEIPQEVGDFGILIHSGFKVKKALLYNFVSALFAILGAIVILIFRTDFSTSINYILPITAGGFLYIAATDLIPELHKKNVMMENIFQVLFMLVGIGIMLLLKALA